MIQFASEEIRTAFHSLPVAKQIEWEKMAAAFYEKGQIIKIYYIEEFLPGCLEASIRIYKEFDVGLPVSSDQLNLPGID